jgi:hypothetical protein
MSDETANYAAMRSLAMAIALFWSDRVRPTKFDQVFILPNCRVRLTIDEFKSPEDTQPIKRLEQVCKTDEDDRIAD